MGMTQSSCWAMISMRVHISTHSPAAVDALRLHALLVGVKKRINKKKEKRNEGFSDEIRKTKTQIGKLGTEEYYVRLGWLNGTPSYLFLLFYSLHLFCLVRFIYLFIFSSYYYYRSRSVCNVKNVIHFSVGISTCRPIKKKKNNAASKFSS